VRATDFQRGASLDSVDSFNVGLALSFKRFFTEMLEDNDFEFNVDSSRDPLVSSEGFAIRCIDCNYLNMRYSL